MVLRISVSVLSARFQGNLQECAFAVQTVRWSKSVACGPALEILEAEVGARDLGDAAVAHVVRDVAAIWVADVYHAAILPPHV